MRGIEELLKIIGLFGDLPKEMLERVSEIRLRAEREARLRLTDGREIADRRISAEELRGIELRLMNGSFYAYEEELRQGFFTLPNGCRVGVCGRISVDAQGRNMLSAVNALCVRVAHEIIGCAAAIADDINGDILKNTLILSPPGMGKTTMIRDLARILSDSGRSIAIADERGEIAACAEGVPGFDVGSRTDVMDGCPKADAIRMLIRACAPDMVIADEIGTPEDAAVILEAARCGVAVAATAHAGDLEEAKRRGALNALIGANVFRRVYLLGDTPGQIIKKYVLAEGEEETDEGHSAGADHRGLHGGGRRVFPHKEASL